MFTGTLFKNEDKEVICAGACVDGLFSDNFDEASETKVIEFRVHSSISKEADLGS